MSTQINLDHVKKRLEEMKKRSKSSSKSSWKPEEGDNLIRIVPYMHNKDKKFPFIETYIHYNLGKRQYLSPHTFGDSDPVIEFCNKLKESGDKDNYKFAGKLFPKFRVYAPVLVRGNEDEGVKFWGFSRAVYQELLSTIADPDYGDITSLGTGRDVVVTKTLPDEQNKYGTITTRVKPNQTVALSDKVMLKEIMLKQEDFFSAVYEKVSYDTLKEALENYLNPEEKADDSSSFDVDKIEKKEEKTSLGDNIPGMKKGNDKDYSDLMKDFSTTSKNKEKKEDKPVSDIDAEFDAMFNEK